MACGIVQIFAANTKGTIYHRCFFSVMELKNCFALKWMMRRFIVLDTRIMDGDRCCLYAAVEYVARYEMGRRLRCKSKA